jgi:predicted amidohydrolase YtcJ
MPSYVIKNAIVGTMSAERPTTSAIAFAEGKITWIGATENAPGADIEIDAKGQTVLPGLIDAHSHLFWMALDRLAIRLAPAEVATIDDVVEKVSGASREIPPDQWITAVGLSEFSLRERRLPTRDDLDRVSSSRPVALKRVCGHAAVVNSRALEVLGIDDDTESPFGGIIERTSGRATGVLRERAADRVFEMWPLPAESAIAGSLDEVAADYHRCGVTGATEAAVGFSCGFDAEWKVWQALRRRGAYKLRMAFMLGLDESGARERGLLPSGLDLDWQVDTLKFFADGTIGSRTAALCDPYAGTTDRLGLLMQPAEALHEGMLAAHRAGWNVAVHAIGDKAIDLVVSSFAEMAKEGRGRRHRIEHLALPSPAAKARLLETGVTVVPQYSFLSAMGDGFVGALGTERADRLYPAKSLIDAGVPIAGSSDAPATPLSPFAGISAAVERRSASGHLFDKSECLTAQQALFAYTSGGARVLGHEGKRGILLPGAVADLIVVKGDTLNAEAASLLDAKINATFVRGECVFDELTRR